MLQVMLDCCVKAEICRVLAFNVALPPLVPFRHLLVKLESNIWLFAASGVST